MNTYKQILRFITAGSVDDGKSTLIGRLLYDGNFLQSDQIQTIGKDSKRKGIDFNFALITDGLKSEREQGITIDVAHKYFSTDRRKFIIADTPGHLQYTRNMITAASTANLAIILIDARNGVTEQTKRHFFICSMLQIPHIIICINKMDIVDYNESIFEKIKYDITEFSENMWINDIHFIPMNALKGDNVIRSSSNIGWYKGPTLMHLLENINLQNDYNYSHSRLSVQYIIRPEVDEFIDFRGYAGQILGGTFQVGDHVIVHPNGMQSKIKGIYYNSKSIDKASYPMSILLTLEDNIDIERGNLISRKDDIPNVGQDIDLMIFWFDKENLVENKRYIIRHSANESYCFIKKIEYKLEIKTLDKIQDCKSIFMNDIAKVKIKSTKLLIYDSFSKNKYTGGIILVDEFNNRTIAAGIIL